MDLNFRQPQTTLKKPILAYRTQLLKHPATGEIVPTTIYETFTKRAWSNLGSIIEVGKKPIPKMGWIQITASVTPEAAKEAIKAAQPVKPEKPAIDFDAVINRILSGDFDLDVELLKEVVRREGLQVRGYKNAKDTEKLGGKVKSALEKKLSKA